MSLVLPILCRGIFEGRVSLECFETQRPQNAESRVGNGSRAGTAER
jgi:hypothetical protein